MEAEAMTTGRQWEHSWLKAAPGARMKPSGGAAAMGLELPHWETWREARGVA